MRPRITRQNVGLVILGCLLGCAVGCLHSAFVSSLSELKAHGTDFEVAPNAGLRFPTFGFDFLISDVLWLSFIQIAGDNSVTTPEKANRCARYLQRIVSLNPNFLPAYYFAAFVLGGDCHRPDLARNIIEKGLHSAPKDWNLFFIAGINEYLFSKNPVGAAEFYKVASGLPGAPPWLAQQVLILGQNIPTALKEISTWNAVYSSAKNNQVRQNAKEHLVTLWSTIYDEAPTAAIKNRASSALNELSAR